MAWRPKHHEHVGEAQARCVVQRGTPERVETRGVSAMAEQGTSHGCPATGCRHVQGCLPVHIAVRVHCGAVLQLRHHQRTGAITCTTSNDGAHSEKHSHTLWTRGCVPAGV